MPQLPIEILWLGLCTGLVFLMQAKFLCLESGLTRSKNNINVAVKNLADLGISLILFWAQGYGLMYGTSYAGIIGLSGFGLNLQGLSGGQTISVLYQAMFCGTAVTILSGAIAERLKFKTYLLIAAVTSGLVYPILKHWMWSEAGWLKSLGVHDFAGATVVHSLGGWTALALLMIVGPRAGRFSESGEPVKITGSSLPTATLGALILWFGWFGFNGGSTMGIVEHVPNVLVNTAFAGAGGLLAALLVCSIRHDCAEVEVLMNGSLAGLVAITANPLAISSSGAIAVGAIGALAMLAVDWVLLKLQVDDAVGAIPVHLGAGVWGTLAVPLFGDLNQLGITHGSGQQLIVQSIAILGCGAWAFGVTTIVFRMVNVRWPLRVTDEEERRGLNISEHGATSELLELFTVMD